MSSDLCAQHQNQDSHQSVIDAFAEWRRSKRRWTKLMEYLTDMTHHVFNDTDRFLDLVACFSTTRDNVALDRLQMENERCHTLTNVVMQILSNSAAFILLGGDHFFKQLATQGLPFAAQFICARQFFGHGIERVGQVADFIIRPTIDALGEVTFGYGLGCVDKREYRAREDPGEEYRDQNTCRGNQQDGEEQLRRQRG